MKPPGLLVRLGYFKATDVLIPNKSLYGLRSAPRAWERERSEKMDNAIIAKAPGDQYGELQLKPHSLVPGLRSIYDGEEIVGMTTMFVDDGLSIGPPEVVMRVIEYVCKLWKTTAQGFLDEIEGRGDLKLERVSELMFLGLRITLTSEGVCMDQHKWLSQELNRRGCLRLNGCDALPSLDHAPTQPAEKNEGHHKALTEVQSDIGSLMWISLRTRPDVPACVSMLACLSTVDQTCKRPSGSRPSLRSWRGLSMRSGC